MGLRCLRLLRGGRSGFLFCLGFRLRVGLFLRHLRFVDLFHGFCDGDRVAFFDGVQQACAGLVVRHLAVGLLVQRVRVVHGLVEFAVGDGLGRGLEVGETVLELFGRSAQRRSGPVHVGCDGVGRAGTLDGGRLCVQEPIQRIKRLGIRDLAATGVLQ